jgi:hypothetical protein
VLAVQTLHPREADKTKGIEASGFPRTRWSLKRLYSICAPRDGFGKPDQFSGLHQLKKIICSESQMRQVSNQTRVNFEKENLYAAAHR